MPELFGLDIAGLINDSIQAAGELRPLTLIKVEPGTRDPARPTAGTNPTTATHGGSGFEEDLQSRRPESVLPDTSTILNILGASLPSGVVPQTNDRVEIDGATYTLLAVESDPARALYTCQAS